jgi:hypothetical protein
MMPEEPFSTALLDDALPSLLTIATRAPSLHNSQPWQFRAGDGAIDLFADPRRRLPRIDAGGRELLISCGAALFGLRLAMRRLGWRPRVDLLPIGDEPLLLARTQIGAASPPRPGEELLLEAVLRRHTHRGPFDDGPLPDGLVPMMQRDAEAEGTTLAFVHGSIRHGQLAELVAMAERRQRRHPAIARELRWWTHPPGAVLGDGIPAQAFPSRFVDRPGALTPRDFDLGRGWGATPPATGTPAATAVLVTGRDTPLDWLKAGQALHRVLLRAAGEWVFATMHSQPIELPALRSALRTQLGLRGHPQMLLQFGLARTTTPTPRRPVEQVIAMERLVDARTRRRPAPTVRTGPPARTGAPAPAGTAVHAGPTVHTGQTI